MKKFYDVEEKVPLLQGIPLSLQHLFAMFGSTVLVPFLLHVNPATALFMNGIGTILYLIIWWKNFFQKFNSKKLEFYSSKK